MRVKASLFLLILGFFQLAPVASASPASEELNTKLNKPLTDYNLGVTNFIEALIRVSSEFQIPLGIAWINNPAARTERSFAWKHATVREVIESIVKTQTDCKVDVRNDVVRVFSLGLVPEGQNFLNVKIKEFEVVNGYTDLAILKLHDLIGSRKHSGFSVGADPDEPKITIKLKDSTVADILDALVLNSPRKIWIVTFSNDPNPTAAGFRRTLTLWNGFSPLPEQGEPALNLLHWGDKIPWPSSQRGESTSGNRGTGMHEETAGGRALNPGWPTLAGLILARVGFSLFLYSLPAIHNPLSLHAFPHLSTVSPNYEIPANPFQPCNFRPSHSNDTTG